MPTKKIIYCPCCGSQSQVRPVMYRVDKEEREAFPGLKALVSEQGFVVPIPTVEIEGGMYNGDRYLCEYKADHFECKACNKMFTVQQ